MYMDYFSDKIAVIGGDKRQLFAADAFIRKGFSVLAAGFDSLSSFGSIRLCSVGEALGGAYILLLPITGIIDGKIKCCFSDEDIVVDEGFRRALAGKLVFMGRAASLSGVRAHDLLGREDFSVANALATAEGAVETAMREFEGTISGSRCLVIGYGRIGSALSRILRALCADVTVCTRSCAKRAEIISDGNTPADTSELESLSGFDIVFNTADALVITAEVLEKSDSDVLIIDLASLPGGVDFARAESLGFTVVHALGLPGKCSPRAAGKILSDTVLNILKEEYRCQRQI